MGIPPFVQQVIGVLVRATVVWLAGYLAARFHVAFTEEQIGQAIAWLSPVAAVLVWSVYQKYRGRLKLLTAAASPHVLTEHEVEEMVSNPNVSNPSVNTPKNEVPR